MTKKHVAIAAIAAVVMIVGAVYTTFWLLGQPVPEVTTGEPIVDAEGETRRFEIQPTSESDEEAVETGLIAIKLYVLAGSGRSLATEEQEIPLGSSVQQQAKEVVQLLVRRSAAFPPGVQLRELFITSQGMAYVDFSNELVQNHPGGSSAEELTVYSLSNTLIANFPSIKLVTILVEGREIPTLAGHLDLTIPYGRGPDYLNPLSERSEPRNEAS